MIDDDFALRTRLAQQYDPAFQFVARQTIGALLLHRTLEKRCFARSALTGAARKRNVDPLLQRDIEQNVRILAIDDDLACAESHFRRRRPAGVRRLRGTWSASEALLLETAHLEPALFQDLTR